MYVFEILSNSSSEFIYERTNEKNFHLVVWNMRVRYKITDVLIKQNQFWS